MATRFERFAWRGDGGVVDQYIDLSEAVVGFGDRAVQVLDLGQVGADRQTLLACFLDQLGRLIYRPGQLGRRVGGGTRDGGDVVAGDGEILGKLFANASAGSGDECDFGHVDAPLLLR